MGLWDYSGKRVAIFGCATGMGEAAARELVRLGAEVHGADIKPTEAPIASFRTVDLRDPASIDAAVADIGGPIDRLFYCAGLPQATFPPLDVMKVNFLGMRHLAERALPLMGPGGAICSIASTAAMGFMKNMEKLQALVATPDFASGLKWCEGELDFIGGGYAPSKEAITVWTMKMGAKLIKQGIRINCTWPAPTQTPMMLEFEKESPSAFIDIFAEPAGRRSTPEEQAWPVLFLNSDAAGFINGHALPVDGGFMGAVTTGEIDLQQAFGAAAASLQKA
jgi:NAD(P)-dependent dehydrogenase (short-subunit alcohol dehydrogenase family)